MIMAGAEDGSVVRIHIQQVYLRCSSLLPVTATTTTAVPTIEAATVTIGHQDRTAAAPSASTSAMSTCSATYTTVRTVTLSVASRNNFNQYVVGQLALADFSTAHLDF